MGLDFAQSKAHWSYSGFMHFRERLANEIGINLQEMQGFGGFAGLPDGWCLWDSMVDPIVPFLNHSDCEGELSPEDCLTVAPRLRELISSWSDDYDKRNALILADDMEWCGREGEPLLFI